MDSVAVIDNYLAAYRTRSAEYMEGKFLENEDLLNDVAETMWSRTLQTIASAVAMREKMEGAPHFCKQPRRYFEQIRVESVQRVGYIVILTKLFKTLVSSSSLIFEH